ncbi:CRISPR-associated exonuclease, Cas4 family [Frankia casuarinae]|uniref:CRISPR-associated exonuclease Cas4 n=1 Tax=Frankia casuarinae (strain DSM 45818 / CECT 9043 / HFP020203 / CcI3) TaxID=106370 RepID=Q2J7P0_FRACC|nr:MULTISPECIES: CRISPR-associated protein Cas4 [Frankia]ABD12702.1 CRISPR-associated exonuclease, Cas4 family [Frankia casuarinae]EYT91147.1 CRISPR-associated exonuclease, Cas4 family [Frankia casuarinae]KDA41606.1 CRISPR-associated exonuclease, Cas4 family [Frankia sp. BMG5.23]TFE24180.1 CRISPR-associated protein Cas4 [Frankia sp. B2]
MNPSDWWPGGDAHAGRLPISALEHHAYCPRQAALIHLDNVFADNIETMRGNVAHAHVHEPSPAVPTPQGNRIRQVTGLQVWSDRLGLYGVCDVVEISSTSAIPIEHKVGPYVPGGPADLQAGAQALCLRDMLTLDVPYAEVFSHTDRRRHRVDLTDTLATRIITAAERMRDILTTAALPEAVADRRCRRCSLHHDCLPELANAAAGTHDLFTPRPAGHWHG